MNANVIVYPALFMLCIVFVVNLSALKFDNSKQNNYLGIISNVVVILLMIYAIYKNNKLEKEKEREREREREKEEEKEKENGA